VNSLRSANESASWRLFRTDCQPFCENWPGLQELEEVTNQTNRELKAAGLATAEGRESAEHLLNRALASMEKLSEVVVETQARRQGSHSRAQARDDQVCSTDSVAVPD
jgi:hypothetical protein